MVPTAAAINNRKVTNKIVRRRAGAPKNTAMPVFTSVFERTATVSYTHLTLPTIYSV